MRRFLPVIALILIAPLVQELLGGSTPITLPISWIFFFPIYSAGALLIHELVRRSGRGWISILLLGAAYGIVEEGLALQSLFNPTLYHAADMGARIFGINGVYTEVVIGIHIVWSVAIPILLTDLLFPDRRNEPYLGYVGLVITAICYVLSVALLWLTTYAFIAKGYVAPQILHILAALVVLVLAIVALAVLPRKVPRLKLQIHAPSAWLVLLVSAIGGFAWQGLLLGLGRALPTFTHWPLVLVPMLTAPAVAAVIIWLVRRWSLVRDWNDLHLLALACGSLVPHAL
ncbi:MAG TPA: hypothetical protein VH593_01545, partial [Ktedonobacteraceae bacterium]